MGLHRLKSTDFVYFCSQEAANLLVGVVTSRRIAKFTALNRSSNV